MGDEHDDDLEAEVEEGAEIETQAFPDLTEDVIDIDDSDRLSSPDEPGHADHDEEPSDDDEASDTI